MNARMPKCLNARMGGGILILKNLINNLENFDLGNLRKKWIQKHTT